MITIENLSKRFGAVQALDGISLEVPAGRIVGFLGPNGAGKSTCLRILTGLVHADSGTATVDGRTWTELPNPGRVVGVLLGTDSFHPGRTGRESLRLAATTMGLPTARIDEVLDEVGLSPAESRRRVGGYSLGMRQRLGMAQALLGEPAALVLDEPTNGLDPQGQRWLAELVRHRAERGCAVLLSSHQLHDVARLAHQVVMIGGGRVLADAATSEIADLEERYFTLTEGRDRGPDARTRTPETTQPTTGALR
ncbi:ABC transporter ATP-binding protein [Luteococcus peritonei]|uniref:ABC transporter ATP-binding protein n=1 Tax=Luteococcus peritonei TaxID=88874 RepID=A0ABW4RZA8_9ACTN